MSERRVIAEIDRFRLLSDGGIEWKSGTRGDITPSDVAFLLIDAARRLTKRDDEILAASCELERRHDARLDQIESRAPRVVPIQEHAFPHPLAGYDAQGRHIHSHALDRGKRLGREERTREIIEFLCSIGEAQSFQNEQTWEGWKVRTVAEIVARRFSGDVS